MKFLFVVCVAIYITTVYSVNVEKSELEECARQNKIDLKMFESLHDDGNFKPTRDMHCFVACALKKANLMDADGKYTKVYDETALVKECKPEYGEDECETAGKLMACISQNELLKSIKAKVQDKP